MQKTVPALLLFAVFGLSACTSGYNYGNGSDLERAAIGAALGCVAGEVIDDGECLTGAAVGGGIGALYDDIM